MIKAGTPTESRTRFVIAGYGTPDAGIDIQMTYTDNGQVESRGDGENHFTMYAYDGHDRLERIDFEGPAFELFGYDAIANKTEYGFDERGYLESSKINGYLVTYLNDAAGRVTDVTYPHGQVIEYFYDDANAVTDIVARQGFNTHTVADYGYDTMGRVTDVDFGDGGSTTYAYDPIGRLKDHTLKRAGQVPNNINLTTLAYNPSSQIVSRSVTQSSYQTAMPTSSPAQYTANNLNQYTFADGSLSYDLNGNLTAYDGWTYAFDAHNRMKSASGPGTSLTLAYDPTGRLNSTTLGTSTTEYVYSGAQLIGEYTQAGNPINLYVYPPGSDIPIARFSGSQGLNDFQYLRSDERGSIVAVTDDIVLESNQYDVYGVPLDGSDSLFRYTGQILLPGTELYHYKARVYHPNLGRFMQTDPIGYEDGMNMYAYVHNDPVNATDPTGEFCVPCLGAAVGLVAEAISIGVDVAGGREVSLAEGAARLGTSTVLGAVGAGIAGRVISAVTGAGVKAVAEKAAINVTVAGVANGANTATRGGIQVAVTGETDVTAVDVAKDVAIGGAAALGGQVLSEGVEAIGKAAGALSKNADLAVGGTVSSRALAPAVEGAANAIGVNAPAFVPDNDDLKK